MAARTKSNSGPGPLFGNGIGLFGVPPSDIPLETRLRPNVLYVLPKHEGYTTFVTARNGNQARPLLEGVTADYAHGMRWELQTGRFLSEGDIENANQVCVLGADTATELFGEESPIGQEVKIRYHWRGATVRLQVVGVMKPKGRSLSIWYSLVIFSIFMGITFGVYSAVLAAQLSPIEAIRTEN